jgi:CubicO group peptidase (beta-lactamase class C family)
MRMRAVDRAMARHVDGGWVPGVVALVAHDQDVQVTVAGHLAFDHRAPMRRDTIFRIASVTKPIVAAGAMILVEEGALGLDDPVDPWLPELAGRPVLRTIESDLEDTVPAPRPITLRDLLTHRMGHGAVMVHPSRLPIQTAMAEAGVTPGPIQPDLSPDELMGRYGSLPLLCPPGEGWFYNSASDILGILLGRMSGTSLGAFLEDRVFGPLHMVDTAFHVPPEKVDRLAAFYRTDRGTGEAALLDPARGGRFATPPRFESGAGGLVSTVDDLLTFFRMLGQGGVHAGGRLLSESTVDAMFEDQLSPDQRRTVHARTILGDARGWGLGLSVVLGPGTHGAGPGSVGWDGGYGTSAYLHPETGLLGILLSQRLWESPEPPAILVDFWEAATRAEAAPSPSDSRSGSGA